MLENTTIHYTEYLSFFEELTCPTYDAEGADADVLYHNTTQSI